jgi:hypothetical protein
LILSFVSPSLLFFDVSQPNWANFTCLYCLSWAEIENSARDIPWIFITEGLSIFVEAIQCVWKAAGRTDAEQTDICLAGIASPHYEIKRQVSQIDLKGGFSWKELNAVRHFNVNFEF